MSYNDIDYKVLSIVDSFNYEQRVNQKVEELKKDLLRKKQNSILTLNLDSRSIYNGKTENEIVEKIAEDIIKYRIQEKAYVKLMAEGLIYPIHLCDQYRIVSFEFKLPSMSVRTGFDIFCLIFDRFMKL